MSDPALPTAAAVPVGPIAPVGSIEVEPPREQLGRRTVNGSLWTIGGYTAVQVVRMASSLILTRLIARELFGVMLVVNTLMIGIRLFSDVGIGPALIANPRGDTEPFLRTAWTTQVIRGFGIWLASIAIALPAAHYYAKTNELMGLLWFLLPVAGLAAVSEGFRSTAVFRLQRNLQFAQQSILDLTEIFVTVGGMIAWAAVGKYYFNLPPHQAVWALVIPPLAGNVAATIVSHYLMRDRRDRLGWDKSCAQELLRVGRWIFVSTLLTFLASNAPSLIFGKLVSTATLADFGIAFALAGIPTLAVMKVGQAVLFPTFARVAADPVRFASVYRRARTMLLVLAATVVAGMIAAGPFAVNTMYSAEYEHAGWMFQLLAIGVWFQIVDSTNVAALLAREHPHWMAGGNLVKVVFMFALVPLAYHYGYGFSGALIALAIADGLRALFSAWGIARLGAARGTTLLADLFLPIAAGAVGWIALKVATMPHGYLDAHIGPGKFHRFLVNGSSAAIAGCLVLAIWAPVCLYQWRVAKRQAP